MKEGLKDWLEQNGYEYTDLGCFNEDSCDYPDIAWEVCEKVAAEDESKGVLVCGTGLGMSMAANKYKGIRAAMCMTEYMAEMAREHNNAQVICFGGRTTEQDLAEKMLRKFLDTKFSGVERHQLRVEKIERV